jgi:hypothetical protein
MKIQFCKFGKFFVPYLRAPKYKRWETEELLQAEKKISWGKQGQGRGTSKRSKIGRSRQEEGGRK